MPHTASHTALLDLKEALEAQDATLASLATLAAELPEGLSVDPEVLERLDALTEAPSPPPQPIPLGIRA